MRYYVIAVTRGINTFWSRGHNSFVGLDRATQFRSAEDAYVELVDKDFTDLAHVKAIPITGS